MKKVISFIVLVLMCSALFFGCSGSDDTVEAFVVSNQSYTTQKDVESAKSADALEAGKEVFASVHFIESPKGMEYTVKWSLDNNEIKSETKATANGPRDTVVYNLEADKAKAGTLKVEIIYKDSVLTTKELLVK